MSLIYKGFVGKVWFDNKDLVLKGKVLNASMPVEFFSNSTGKIEPAFQAAVDKHISACDESGSDPEKAFSGKFVLRIDPELHRLITGYATSAGKSLNQWILDVIVPAAELGR
ncbi:MAG: type II toxin-antitoxin system HicB family antitoxin [bacterium]|nr:type II toxin-antitoxin system HicB family antitoxin [bacterium]